MSLTISDRTRRKERIAKRIDQHIETIVARQDPTLLERVSKEARQEVFASLSIDSQRRELEDIEKQKEEMEKRERRLKANSTL